MDKGSSALQDKSRAVAPVSVSRADKPWPPCGWHMTLVVLTISTLLIHGYHPFAEDGGVYAAGIEYTLDPTLFPHETMFVREHLRFSLFAPGIAALARLTHLSLAWILFGVYMAVLWFTFYAARQILRRCFVSDTVQVGGLALLAVWATLPVAGTSLLLIDPYLTARSLSTPLSLWAIAMALDIPALDAWAPEGSVWDAPASRPSNQNPYYLEQFDLNFSMVDTRAPHALGGGRVGRWSGLLGCLLCLAGAALVHPLMAGFAAATVAFVCAARSPHWTLAWGALTLLAVLLAGLIGAIAPAESPAAIAAAYSRSYWFLSQWRWYELLGLAGPLLVLLGVTAVGARLVQAGQQIGPSERTREPFSLWRKPEARLTSSLFHAGNGTPILCPVHDEKRRALVTLSRACIGLGLAAVLVALLFAREGTPTHLLARLQPLRVFLLIYAVMALLLGATVVRVADAGRKRLLANEARTLSSASCSTTNLACRFLMRIVAGSGSGFAAQARAVAVLMLLSGVAFYVQRQTFPASQHLELPWRAARNPNPWTRAFLWARAHTPRDALFALDARYINEPGEDAQTFRATALRSALPDYSKDGGEASITPGLATLWEQGVSAQVKLSEESDNVRAARLRPLGVNWMVLHSSAPTQQTCPYNNGTVKVCRLDP